MAANAVSPVTVALVDDYDLVLSGLAHMLGPYRDRARIVEIDANEAGPHRRRHRLVRLLRPPRVRPPRGRRARRQLPRLPGGHLPRQGPAWGRDTASRCWQSCRSPRCRSRDRPGGGSHRSPQPGQLPGPKRRTGSSLSDLRTAPRANSWCGTGPTGKSLSSQALISRARPDPAIRPVAAKGSVCWRSLEGAPGLGPRRPCRCVQGQIEGLRYATYPLLESYGSLSRRSLPA